jgi:hypothetical protein
LRTLAKKTQTSHRRKRSLRKGGAEEGDQKGEEAGTQRHQCSTDGEGVRRCLMREIWKRYGSRLKCF